MKRVEVNIDESVRGLASKYSNKKNITMPSAYSELLKIGLLECDMELGEQEKELIELRMNTERA